MFSEVPGTIREEPAELHVAEWSNRTQHFKILLHTSIVLVWFACLNQDGAARQILIGQWAELAQSLIYTDENELVHVHRSQFKMVFFSGVIC